MSTLKITSDFLGRVYSIDAYKRLFPHGLETPDTGVMTLHGMNQAFFNTAILVEHYLEIREGRGFNLF